MQDEKKKFDTSPAHFMRTFMNQDCQAIGTHTIYYPDFETLWYQKSELFLRERTTMLDVSEVRILRILKMSGSIFWFLLLTTLPSMQICPKGE